MKNRSALAAALAAASVCVSAPAAAEATAAFDSASDSDERVKLAGEIIELGVPVAEREALFFQTIDAMTAQMRAATLGQLNFSDPALMEIFDTWLASWVSQSKTTMRAHIPSLMKGWTIALSEIYTAEELGHLRTFVSTPTGAKFFLRQADLIRNRHFAAANEAYMAEIMQQLPAAQAELSKQLQAYLAKTAKK